MLSLSLFYNFILKTTCFFRIRILFFFCQCVVNILSFYRKLLLTAFFSRLFNNSYFRNHLIQLIQFYSIDSRSKISLSGLLQFTYF